MKKDMASLAGTINWNPWHGCTKKSEGCAHCYVYELDAARGVANNAHSCHKTSTFGLPLQTLRNGTYKIPRFTQVMTCMTSDFFLEDADEYREEAWDIIRIRKDLLFMLVTKRPELVLERLPKDWGRDGWPNVWLNVSIENQLRADERLPILLTLPFQHKGALAAPLLESINISSYLQTGQLEAIYTSGEHAVAARPLDIAWVEDLYEQCRKSNINFSFFSTGSILVKNGRSYNIPRSKQKEQAEKANYLYLGKPIILELSHEIIGQQRTIFDESEET